MELTGVKLQSTMIVDITSFECNENWISSGASQSHVLPACAERVLAPIGAIVANLMSTTARLCLDDAPSLPDGSRRYALGRG